MSAGNNAFTAGATVNVVTANGTSTPTALTVINPSRSRQILVTNSGATPLVAFIKFGTSTVSGASASADTPILPSSAQIFTVDATTTHVSVVSTGTTGILYFTTGDGS